jgi:hypothetical protein
MKLDKKTIGLVLTVALVVAQSFGIVPTVSPSEDEHPCVECPRCGSTEVDGGN